MAGRVPIGELLVKQGRIDALQLQSALAHQRQWGGRLGRALVSLGFVTEQVLLQAVGEQLGIPFVEIGARPIPPRVVQLVPEKLIRSRGVVPLELLSESRRGPLLVALSDPDNLATLDEIAFATGMNVKPVLAAEADVANAIARLLGGAVPPPRFSEGTHRS
jgi:type IV pilus assembly protein PilB